MSAWLYSREPIARALLGMRAVSHRISSTLWTDMSGRIPPLLIAVRRGTGIFQGGKDFEHPADRAACHKLFRVSQWLVKSPLKAKHQAVRVIAVEFARQRHGRFRVIPVSGFSSMTRQPALRSVMAWSR